MICNFCNKEVDFLPYQHNSASNIIGAGYREKCICPLCDSRDRERFILEFVKTYIFEGARVLHISPERRVEKYLVTKNMKYMTSDYGRLKVKTKHRYNIENMPECKSEQYDFILCNHVLEHVTNLSAAMNELMRVTKPGGIVELSFPICLSKLTDEDTSPLTDEERAERFGQKDHVRLFGFDYMKYFQELGEVSEYIPTKEQIDTLSLIPGDRLILIKKQA